MEIEIKDYLWDIILDWEMALKSETIYGDGFGQGIVDGRIAMLSDITRRPAAEIRSAVVNEAHSVGRLLGVN